MNKTYKRGLLAAIGSAIFFGIAPVFSQLAYKAGLNTITLVLLRFGMAVPILFILAKSKGVKLTTNKRVFGRLLIAGAMLLLTSMCLYSSYKYIGIGMTTTIHFLYPLLVIMIGAVFFGQIISKLIIKATVISLLGICLLIEFQNTNIFLGLVLSLLSALFYAWYLVMLEKFKLASYPHIFTMFYLNLIGFLVIGIAGVSTKTLVFSSNLTSYVMAMIVMALTAFGGFFLLHEAVKNSNAVIVSLFSLLEPICSTFSGILFFREKLVFRYLLGGALVLISLIIISKNEEKLTPANEAIKA